MTIAEWLAMAKADAEKRGLPELIPALEGLAQATERLRAADWNDAADKQTPFDSDGQSAAHPSTSLGVTLSQSKGQDRPRQ
jgi:hypothetical protein